MPASPRAYVILLHVLPDGSRHWDLCLDQGRKLATWQLLDDPSGLASGGKTVPARRIADHRPAYLEYEGPVSGNRGHVTRIDQGSYLLVACEPNRWRIRLDGSILIGTYEIRAAGDSTPDWMLHRLERS